MSRSETKRAENLVAGSLDQAASTADLAMQAYQSRSQFHRWFRAAVEETPQAMRRRLLLERAAWQLHNSSARATDIAFDAGYGSLEAFTRAFTRAYGVSPSLYRRIGSGKTELASPNGIHFRSPGRVSNNKGATNMDLYERFAGNDTWHTQRLLEYAAQLTDEQLDRPLAAAVEILPWREASNSLRQLLENIIYTKEVWAAALLDRKDFHLEIPAADKAPARMLARLNAAEADCRKVFDDVALRNRWDDEFVDALCEPAENFTYGGVFAHIITFNAHRRIQALDALRQLGVVTKGFGDPMEYEEIQNAQSLASRSV